MSNYHTLSASAIAGLSADQVGDLSLDDFQAMSAAQKGALTATQIGALSATLLNQMRNGLQDFTPAQVAALSYIQFIALWSGVGSTLATVTRQQLGAIPPAIWGRFDWNLQWALLKAGTAQGQALTLQDKLLALSGAQLNAMGGDALDELLKFGMVSADAVAQLAPATIGKLPLRFFSGLDQPRLAALGGPDPVVAARVVQALSSIQLNALSAVQWGVIIDHLDDGTGAWRAGLTAAQLGGMSAASRALIPDSLKGAVPNEDKFASLSALELAALSPTVIAGMTRDRVVAEWWKVVSVNHGFFSTLEPQKQFATGNGYFYGRKDAEIYKALSAAQMAAIGHPEAFGPEVAAVLSAQQISALTMDWSTMPDAFVGAISPATFAALSPQKVAAMPVSGFSQGMVLVMTPAQLAALSPAQMARLPHPGSLAAATVGALSVAQLQALTADQLRQLNAAQIGALSPAQLLAPWQVARTDLDTPRFGATVLWTDAQLGALGATQVAGLVGRLTAAQINVIAPQALAGLDAGQLQQLAAGAAGSGMWTQLSDGVADYAFLAAVQVQALSPEQFAALAGPGATVSMAAARVLTAAQLAALPDNIAWGRAMLQAVAPSALAGLRVQQCAALTGYLAWLLPAQAAALSPGQLAALPAVAVPANAAALLALAPWQLAWLGRGPDAATPPAVRQLLGQLSARQLQAFNAGGYGVLPPVGRPDSQAAFGRLGLWQIAALGPADIAACGDWLARGSVEQLMVLAPEQIAALSPAQLSGLRSEQLASLSTAQRAALPPVARPDSKAVFRDLAPWQCAALGASDLAACGAWLDAASADQLAALSGEQLGALPARDLARLGADQVRSLSGAQRAGLAAGLATPANATALCALALWQLACLDEAQIAACADWVGGLSLAQLSVWTSAQIGAVGGHGLSATQLDSLAPAVLAGMTPAQLQTLSTYAAGLSARPVGWQWLTAAQAAQLSAAQIAAVSAGGAISVAACAVLSAEQVASLAPGLLAAMTAAMMQALPAASLARVGQAWCQALSRQAVAALTSAQLGALSPLQQAALGKAGDVSGAAVQGLTAGQIAALSPDSLRDWSATAPSWRPAQLNALGAEQWKAIFLDLDANPASGWRRLSGAQVAGLSPAARALLPQVLAGAAPSSSQFAALAPLQVAALSADQLGRGSGAWKDNPVTGAQLAVFSQAQWAAFAQVATLDPLAVAALTADQVGALTSQTLAQMNASSLASLGTVGAGNSPRDVLAALSPAQLDGLSADQWRHISRAWFTYLSPAQLGGMSAASRARMPGIYFNPDQKWFATLTALEWAMVTPEDLARATRDPVAPARDGHPATGNGYLYARKDAAFYTALSAAQMAGIGHPEAFRAEVVAQFSPAQIAALSVDWGAMPGEFIGALSAAAFAALTTAQLGALGASVGPSAILPYITGAQFAALSPEQVGALPTAGFSQDMVSALTPALLAGLAPAQLARLPYLEKLATSTLIAMGTAQLQALTGAQLNQLSASQVQALSAAQLLALPAVATPADAAARAKLAPWQVARLDLGGQVIGATTASWTDAQLGALSPSQVAGLIGQLGSAQINAITPQVLASLSVDQLRQLGASAGPAVLRQLANGDADYVFLTAAQLRALSPAQLGALVGEHGVLSVAAAQALTAAQVAALADHLPWSRNMLQAVEPAALAGLRGEQCANLATAAGWLLPAQLAALSPQQVARLPLGALSDQACRALTPVQLAGLPADSLRALGAHSQLLSATQVGALTAPQWRSVLAALENGDRVWLGLANHQEVVAGIGAEGRAALAQAGVAAITSKLQFDNLSLLQLAALAPAQIGAASAAWSIEGTLSAAHLGVLSAAQVGAFQHVAALPVALLAVLTPAQAAALSAAGKAWAEVSAAGVAALAPATLAALPPATIATLGGASDSGRAAVLDALTAQQVAALSAAQLAALPPLQLGQGASLSQLTSPQLLRLTPAQIAVLGAAQCASLTAAQVALMAPAQVAALKELAWLSTSALGALTRAQIEAIPGTYNWDAMSAAARAASGTGIAALSARAVAALPSEAMLSAGKAMAGNGPAAAAAIFTTAQLAGLSEDQRGVLAAANDTARLHGRVINSGKLELLAYGDAVFFAGLSRADLLNLEARDCSGYAPSSNGTRGAVLSGQSFESLLDSYAVQSMSPDQISYLRPERMNDVALATLTAAQLGALCDAGRDFSQLGADQVASISAATLAGMSPSALRQLDRDNAWGGAAAAAAQTVIQDQFAKAGGAGVKVSGLTANQCNALSATQLQALSVNCFAGMSAETLTHLSTKTVQALTPSQVGALSLATLEGAAAMLEKQPGLSGAGNFFSALSPAQVAHLSTTQLVQLSRWALQQLTAEATAALSVALFADASWKIFTTTESYVVSKTRFVVKADGAVVNYGSVNPLREAIPGDDRFNLNWTVAVSPQLTDVAFSKWSDAQLAELNDAQRSQMYAVLRQQVTQTAAPPTRVVSDEYDFHEVYEDIHTSPISYRVSPDVSHSRTETYRSAASYSYPSTYQIENAYQIAVASLPDHVIAALPGDILAALPSAQLGALSATQISVMSPTQVSAISNLAALNDAALGALTAPQLVGVTPFLFASLTAAQLSHLAPATLAGLSGAQLGQIHVAASSLTAAQVAGLSAGQLGQLGDGGRLSATAVGTLDFADVAALCAAGNWNGLNAAQVAALTPAAIAGLSVAALAGLAPDAVAALGAAQLLRLSGEQVAALATPARLGVAALSGLTAVQAAAIADWTGFSAAQIGAMAGSAVAGVAPAALAAWTPAQIGALSYVQVGTMTAGQFAALPAGLMAALTPSAVAGLGRAQLAALTAVQWSGCDSTQLGALSKDQVAAIAPALMAALPPRVVGAIAGAIDPASATGLAQLAALDTAQRAALPAVPDSALAKDGWGRLTATQLAALTPAQLGAQRDGWTLEASLGADQVRVLSAAQFGALRRPAAMAAAAAAAISAAQLAALPAPAWATLTAGFIAALAPAAWSQVGAGTADNPLAQLPTAALNALSGAQLGQFGAAARAALPPFQNGATRPAPDARALALWQLAALTPAQLSAADELSSALSAAQLAALSPSQVAALAHPERLTALAVGAMSGAQALALAPAVWAVVSADWLGALQPAAIAALATPADGAAPAAALWSAAAVAGLTAPQLAAFSAEQLAQLAAISGLSPVQVRYLSAVQIAAIGGKLASTLTGDQIAAFSADQIAHLPAAALGAFSPTQVLQLFNNAALRADPSALSDYQMQNFNGLQRALLAVGAPGLAPVAVTVLPSGGIASLTRLQLSAMPGGKGRAGGPLGISDVLAAAPSQQQRPLLLAILPLLSDKQRADLDGKLVDAIYASVMSEVRARASQYKVNSFGEAVFGPGDTVDARLFGKADSLNGNRLLDIMLAGPDGQHVDPDTCLRLVNGYIQTYNAIALGNPIEGDQDQFTAQFMAAPDAQAKFALLDSLAGKHGREAGVVLSGYADTGLAARILLPAATVATRQSVADAMALLKAGPQRAELFDMLQQTEQRVSGGGALLAALFSEGVASGSDPAVLSKALAKSMPTLSALTSSSTLAGLSRNLSKWEGLSRAVFTVLEENNKQFRDGLLRGLGSWIEADRFAVPDVDWDHVYGGDAGTAGALAGAFQTRLRGFSREFSTVMGVDLDSGTDALSTQWRQTKAALDEQFGYEALQGKGAGLSVADEDEAFNAAFGKSLAAILDEYTPTRLSAAALSKVRNQTLALRVVGSFAGFIGSISGVADTFADPKKKDLPLVRAAAVFKVLSELAGALDVSLSFIIKDYIEYRGAQEAGVEPVFSTRFKDSFKTLKAAFATLTAAELAPGAATNFYTAGRGATVEASALPAVSVQTAADGRTQVLVANDSQAAVDGRFDITARIEQLVQGAEVGLNSEVKIKEKFQSKAVGLAGNLLGLGSGALSIAAAATNDQLSLDDKTFAIVNGSLGLTTSTSGIAGALVDSLGEGLGKLTTRLGLATSVVGILSGAVDVAKNGRALDALYQKGGATPQQIQLAQAGVADASLQLVMGFTALALSAICPPAALLTLLLPNFQSICQAVQLKSTSDQLSGAGLSKDAEAVYVLYQIAALNAAPIVNWFSLAYSPKMKSDEVGRIDKAWLQAAVRERLSWYLAGVNANTGAGNSDLPAAVRALNQLLSGAAPGAYGRATLVLGNQQTFDYYDQGSRKLVNSVYLMSVQPNANSGVGDVRFDADGAKLNHVAVADGGNTMYLVQRDDKYASTIELDLSATSGKDLVLVDTANVNLSGSKGDSTYVVSNHVDAAGVRLRSNAAQDTVVFSSVGDRAQRINLDNFAGAYRVMGTDNGDTVSGSRDGALFLSGGGADRIALSGADAVVSAGMAATVSLSGAAAQLFVRCAPTDNDAVGSFVDTRGDGTLDFLPSEDGMKFDVDGATIGIQSTRPGSFDIASAKGFSALKGSAHGDDVITVVGSHAEGAGDDDGLLRQLVCGDGDDHVIIDDSTGLQVTLGAGDSVVQLKHGARATVFTQRGAQDQLIEIGDDSSATLFLCDDDTVNVLGGAAGVNIWSGAGEHRINNQGAALQLYLDSTSSMVRLDNSRDVGAMQYLQFGDVDTGHLLLGRDGAGAITLRELGADQALNGTGVVLTGQTGDTYIECMAPAGAAAAKTSLNVNALVQAMAAMVPGAAGAVQLAGQQTMYQVSALVGAILAPAHA